MPLNIRTAPSALMAPFTGPDSSLIISQSAILASLPWPLNFLHFAAGLRWWGRRFRLPWPLNFLHFAAGLHWWGRRFRLPWPLNFLHFASGLHWWGRRFRLPWPLNFLHSAAGLRWWGRRFRLPWPLNFLHFPAGLPWWGRRFRLPVATQLSTFRRWLALVGQAVPPGGAACHPALDQGQCSAERTNPAETGFCSM